MSATLELFERYKQSIGAQADSRGAQALGVKRQTVNNWRMRASQAEPRLIEAMCLALREDVTPWLLRVQLEQSPHASNRQVWQRVREKLGYRMSGMALALCLPAAGSWCFGEAPLVHAARMLAHVQAWVELALVA